MQKEIRGWRLWGRSTLPVVLASCRRSEGAHRSSYHEYRGVVTAKARLVGSEVKKLVGVKEFRTLVSEQTSSCSRWLGVITFRLNYGSCPGLVFS